jgi:hypothetical protein
MSPKQEVPPPGSLLISHWLLIPIHLEITPSQGVCLSRDWVLVGPQPKPNWILLRERERERGERGEREEREREERETFICQQTLCPGQT